MENEEVVLNSGIEVMKHFDINLYDLIMGNEYDLIVFRCLNCAMEMVDREYNPYIYEDGTEIPVNRIKVITVTIDQCENTPANFEQDVNPYGPISLIKLRKEFNLQ